MEQAIKDLKELNTMGLRPEKYTGTSNPEKFFKKFDRLATYGDWDNAKKAKVIPLLLDEKASDFFDILEDDKKNDFEELKKAMCEHFECNKSKLVRWSELNQKEMSAGQSVTDFHDELVEEAKKFGEVSDEQLMIFFVSNLLPDCKEFVALSEPKTLAESLAKARLYESLQKSKKKVLLAANSTGTTVHLEGTLVKMQDMINKNSEMIIKNSEINSEMMREIMAEVKEIRNENRQPVDSCAARTNVSSNNAPPARRRKASKKRPRCFFCKNTGHLIASCDTFKRHRANRQSLCMVVSTPPCKGKLVRGIRLGPGASRSVEIYPDQNIFCKEIFVHGMNEKRLLVTEKYCSGIEATWKIQVTNTLKNQVQLRAGTAIAIIDETKAATVNALGDVKQSSAQSDVSTDTVAIQTSEGATNLTMEPQQQIMEEIEGSNQTGAKDGKARLRLDYRRLNLNWQITLGGIKRKRGPKIAAIASGEQKRQKRQELKRTKPWNVAPVKGRQEAGRGPVDHATVAWSRRKSRTDDGGNIAYPSA